MPVALGMDGLGHGRSVLSLCIPHRILLFRSLLRVWLWTRLYGCRPRLAKFMTCVGASKMDRCAYGYV
jgi:hypothetical protein